MKKKISVIVIILLIIILGAGVYLIFNKSSELTDTEKFIEEYTSLNDTIRESDGMLYNNVELSEDISVTYLTALEAVELIESGSGIIYFGANWCPWCRNAIEVLFAVAEDYDIDTIYYVDMDDVRNTWEVKNGTLVKTKEEGEGYYELLNALDSILGDSTYKLTYDDEEYDTGEKRIYMPLVVAIKDGNILSSKTGTVSLDDGQTKYDELTNVQYEELYEIYESMVRSVYN